MTSKQFYVEGGAGVPLEKGEKTMVLEKITGIYVLMGADLKKLESNQDELRKKLREVEGFEYLTFGYHFTLDRSRQEYQARIQVGVIPGDKSGQEQQRTLASISEILEQSNRAATEA